MKETGIYVLTLAAFCAALTGCTNHQPLANLLVNGDAEVTKFDSLPTGWVNVQGHWVTEEADSIHHDCGMAQSGKALFFAGNDTLGILEQDVDLKDYASAIAAGKQKFIFSGYAQSLDQGPGSDQAQIVVFALDKAKQNLQVLYDSDTTRSLNKWLLLQDTFAVTPSAAFIRVHLVAVRHVGGDNDGYFDNIKLMAQPQPMSIWLWVIAGVLVIAVAIGGYRLLKRKQPLKKSI